MRTAPANWATLMASPLHKTETKVIINGVEYLGFDGESGIFSLETSQALYEDLSVGNCPAATITLVLANPQAIPKMAKIEVYVRLVEDSVSTTWVRKGVFFIDTREWDAKHILLTITGYDAMLKCEQPYLTTGSVGTWPKKDAVVVSEICSRIGVTLDTRTVLNKNYDVQLPAVSSDGSDSDSLRSVLGWVGAMYGGNWCITDEGLLRLVPLVPTTSVIVGTELNDFKPADPYDALGTIHLIVDEDHEYTAGTTGRSIEIECPWGTQAMANNLLTALRGYVYEPYEADTVFIADPLWELGDGVSIGESTTSVIARAGRVFSLAYVESLAAPNGGELEHEYPFTDSSTRLVKREIAKSVASIKVDIDSINMSVSGTGGTTTFQLKMGSAVLSTQTVDLHVKSVNIDGRLVADAIVANSSITSPSIYGGTLFSSDGYGSLVVNGGSPEAGFTVNNLSLGKEIFRVDQESYGHSISTDVYLQELNIFSTDGSEQWIYNIGALQLTTGMYGTADPSGAATNGTLYFKI